MITSGYISNEVKTDKVNTLPDLYDELSVFFKELQSKISFKILEKNTLDFNGTKIRYTLRFHPKIKKFILSFYPILETTSTYSATLKRFNDDTLQFIKQLGDTITLDSSKFDKFDIKESIDIKDWKITVNDTQDYTANEFIENKKERLKEYFDVKKPILGNKKVVIVNLGRKPAGILSFLDPLNKLKSFLTNWVSTNIELNNDPELLIDKVESSSEYKSAFFIFAGPSKEIDESYQKMKIALYKRNVPCQFIWLDRADNINPLKNNLLLEILRKCSVPNIDLRPVYDEIDGFICLSEVFSKSNDLFGINVLLKGLSGYEDSVEIFKGLKFYSTRSFFKMDESNTKLLSEKITQLVNLTNHKVDVYLTKRWHYKSIMDLITYLQSRNIQINKVFYISTKVNKFVTSFITESLEDLYKSPYINFGKIAFLQSNSKFFQYGNLFPLFIELLYPNNKDIIKQDLVNILWSVKKRLYRIDNFFTLKSPEPISLFRSARKTYLNYIDTPLKMKIAYLI